MPTPAADGRAGITACLVQRLLASQFPQWSCLPVRPVRKDGRDNRTYRLGATLTARLPTAAGYEEAVAKENRWLPRLAPNLPLEIPAVRGVGTPGHGYAHAWSVRSWDRGGHAGGAGRNRGLGRGRGGARPLPSRTAELRCRWGPASGRALLRALQAAPPAHDFDHAAAAAVWKAALAQEWDRPPVWFHGDLAAGNLLARGGRLRAVIDFGTCGVGDPACDLVPAWTMFEGSSREAFKGAVAQDPATWARARGWALWKALITLVDDSQPAGEKAKALASGHYQAGD